ncbi:MAG: hypothetical protein M0006_17380 [Magnetospirillum sp.]|nr:hypothetical protein [Magnetospirillum sp.]
MIVVAALFLTVGQLPPWASKAVAASSQTKQEFNNIILSLQAADSAYAAGNNAEAQAKYNQAKSRWNQVSAAISKSEAHEVQTLFDALGDQMKKKAPATEIKSTISDMVDELHEDIESIRK